MITLPKPEFEISIRRKLLIRRGELETSLNTYRDLLEEQTISEEIKGSLSAREQVLIDIFDVVTDHNTEKLNQNIKDLEDAIAAIDRVLSERPKPKGEENGQAATARR